MEIEGGLLGLLVGGSMDVRTGAGDDELLLYNVTWTQFEEDDNGQVG